jgi:hypothetical protein
MKAANPPLYRKTWALPGASASARSYSIDRGVLVRRGIALSRRQFHKFGFRIRPQSGNRAKALEWLETALRLRDPGLEFLKTDPLMDPLRQEPRFQAIERELKFPS